MEDDLKRIFGEFNETGAEFPSEKTLHKLFEEQVKKSPNGIAVIFKNDTLTYRELDERVNSLARLIQKKGEKKGDRPEIYKKSLQGSKGRFLQKEPLGRRRQIEEDGDRRVKIVAVMVERSFEMMIALLAILKVGGAYLPISPSNPLKRIEYILKDSGASILLVQEKGYERMRDIGERFPGVEVVNLDDEESYTLSPEPLNIDASPTDPAYIIYTSGSTGNPKGVVIEHRSVVNRLYWMQRRYPLDSTHTLLQKTPYFFDVSVWEMFWWFFAGARVCFLHPGVEKFPQFIVDTVEKWNITVIHFVPSMLSPFLHYIQNDEAVVGRLKSLKRVFTSGESLLPAHVRTFNDTLFRINGTCLTNLYGPTEATVDVTYYDCPPGEDLEKVPIGKPIDNTKVYIVNNQNKPVAIGEEGEIVLTGTGIARGYLNNPAMTSEKFGFDHQNIKKSNGGGGNGVVFLESGEQRAARLYSTGDLGRWLPDGNIEYLGRRDHQVKIRGLRIELGEIESAVANREDVRGCVVLVKEYSSSVILIVAYVVLAEGCRLTEKELKSDLKQILPDYMVPNRCVFLPEFPLTPSGKIDRKALPEPEFK